MPNESREAEKRTDTASPVDRRVILDELNEIIKQRRRSENLRRALDRDIAKELEKID